MQKFRVSCPHCEASLLVTEDLLGRPGSCPGCHAGFQLPTAASLNAASARPMPAQPLVVQGTRPWGTESPPQTESTPPPPPVQQSSFELEVETPQRSRTQKSVKIEGRPALRIIANLLKFVAILQILAACLILIVLLVVAIRSAPAPEIVLGTIGGAILIALSAIPTLAFSELIFVFIAQEEMLRHTVNQLRSRE